MDGAQGVLRELVNHSHLDTVLLVLRSHDCLYRAKNSRLLLEVVVHWALRSGKRRRILQRAVMPIAPVPAVALEIAPVPAVALEIWHASQLVASSYCYHVVNTANANFQLADVQHASLAPHAYRVNTANANVQVHVQQREGQVGGVDDPCFVARGTVLLHCRYDACPL